MTLLQSSRKYLAMFGISPCQSLLNVKFFMAAFANAINVGSNWIFLIFEANSFQDYTNSIFLTSTVTMEAICFVLFNLKNSRIFAFIDLFDKRIENSELEIELSIIYCSN